MALSSAMMLGSPIGIFLSSLYSSLLFAVFDICGTLGSGLGGLLTEKWDSRHTLVILSMFYTVVMAGYLVSNSIGCLFVNTALLGLVGWSINAPTQSYLIERSEKYASINQSVLHPCSSVFLSVRY